MRPAMERRPSRSTYRSVSTLPSCTATRVSMRPALTTIRFPTWNLDPGRGKGPAAILRLVELPHSDREQEPEPHQRHHHGRPAVTHQRQGNPHDGQETRHHPQVDQGLGGEDRGHPERKNPPPGLPCAGGNLEPPEHQESVRRDQHEATDEPPHLGEYGKYEVSVALGEKGEAALRRAARTFPEELP